MLSSFHLCISVVCMHSSMFPCTSEEPKHGLLSGKNRKHGLSEVNVSPNPYAGTILSSSKAFSVRPVLRLLQCVVVCVL